MRWARSETQLDLTDGRFRDQVADLAAPVHGMAKDELASEDVRQHRRAMRQAVAAGIALGAAHHRRDRHLDLRGQLGGGGAAQRGTRAHRAAPGRRAGGAREGPQEARRREERARGEEELTGARRVSAHEAQVSAQEARKQKGIAEKRALDLAVANGDLNTANQNLDERQPRPAEVDAAGRGAPGRPPQRAVDELGRPDLSARGGDGRGGGAPHVREQRDRSELALVEQRLPRRRVLAARHPDRRLGREQRTGRALERGRQVRDGPLCRLCEPEPRRRGRRTAAGSPTFSSAQSARPDVVQVWNTDGTLAASATSRDRPDVSRARCRATGTRSRSRRISRTAPGPCPRGRCRRSTPLTTGQLRRAPSVPVGRRVVDGLAAAARRQVGRDRRRVRVASPRRPGVTTARGRDQR